MSTFAPYIGLILPSIRAEYHGLNANEHGMNTGFGVLPFGFGRTYPGAKEAEAYYLLRVSSGYAIKFLRYEN